MLRFSPPPLTLGQGTPDSPYNILDNPSFDGHSDGDMSYVTSDNEFDDMLSMGMSLFYPVCVI